MSAEVLKVVVKENPLKKLVRMIIGSNDKFTAAVDAYKNLPLPEKPAETPKVEPTVQAVEPKSNVIRLDYLGNAIPPNQEKPS